MGNAICEDLRKIKSQKTVQQSDLLPSLYGSFILEDLCDAFVQSLCELQLALAVRVSIAAHIRFEINRSCWDFQIIDPIVAISVLFHCSLDQRADLSPEVGRTDIDDLCALAEVLVLLVEDHLQHVSVSVEEVVRRGLFDVREVVLTEADEENVRSVAVLVFIGKERRVVGYPSEFVGHLFAENGEGVSHDALSGNGLDAIVGLEALREQSGPAVHAVLYLFHIEDANGERPLGAEHTESRGEAVSHKIEFVLVSCWSFGQSTTGERDSVECAVFVGSYRTVMVFCDLDDLHTVTFRST